MESARFLTREGTRGVGVTRSVIVPKPAAGADWSVSVPGGVSWRLLLATASLTTSAAVANRLPRFRITDGSNILATFEGLANVAAGAAVTYSLISGSIGAVAGPSGAFPQLGIPLLSLPPGFTVQSVTAALDVADQWSAVVLTIEEWFEEQTSLSERVEEHRREEVSLAEALAGSAYRPT